VSAPVHKTDGRRDPLDRSLKTACGIHSMTGGVGELDSSELSTSWRFVTCEKCKREQTRGITPAMVRMLESAPVYGRPQTRLFHTKKALTVRGLLAGGELTDAGRAYLDARKKRRK